MRRLELSVVVVLAKAIAPMLGPTDCRVTSLTRFQYTSIYYTDSCTRGREREQLAAVRSRSRVHHQRREGDANKGTVKEQHIHTG
jgi:hypothetical protein